MRRSLWFSTARPPASICLAALIGAIIGVSARASAAPNHVTAKDARTISLSETAHMEVSKHEIDGAEISESGYATGSYNVPVTAGLTLHAKYVTAIINIFLKGGSITATADANFTQKGSTGTFNGTLKITRGTGAYSRAQGQLKLKGGFNHLTFKMWVVAVGTAKYS
jgi:hypothetical protein